MTPPPALTLPSATAVQTHQLTESHRFDAELAAILTQFQYRADGIELTAVHDRPLSQAHLTSSTPGVAAVYNADASLVFVCYEDRTHTTVNPIETALIEALTTAIDYGSPSHAGSTTAGTQPLGEGVSGNPSAQGSTSGATGGTNATPDSPDKPDSNTAPTVGVVTPHNAQRGALSRVLPAAVTANTVEKYQGGERDVIAVSATVSNPQFARREAQFILNPRRLLVAISRSKALTIVVCSTALFEVAPRDGDRLAQGPLWARLFTQAVGRDPTPAWAGSLGAFTGTTPNQHTAVPVAVYPSTVDTD